MITPPGPAFEVLDEHFLQKQRGAAKVIAFLRKSLGSSWETQKLSRNYLRNSPRQESSTGIASELGHNHLFQDWESPVLIVAFFLSRVSLILTIIC